MNIKYNETLTEKQQNVLDFINSWYKHKGYPPTIREIASHIGVKSTNAVWNYLKILYRKGYLTREDMKSRTWRPVEKENSHIAVSVPIIGKIAAGNPISAEENKLGVLQIDVDLLDGATHPIALQVIGDSMVEAGILDGDYVFIDQKSPVCSGDIVAALIGGEATVKYYYRDHGIIRLQPANKNMAPIYIKPGRHSQVEIVIIGKVIGIYRKLT